MDELAALLPHFLEETVPLADALAPALVELERTWARGERDPAAEQRALGDVHTIKGNGAMMGFEPIQQVAHALEDVLEAPGRRDAAAGALLVRGGDLLHALVHAADGPLDADAAARFVGDAAALLAGVTGEPAPRPLRLAPVGKAAETLRVPFRALDELARLATIAASGPPEVAADALRRLRAQLADLRFVPLATIFDRFGRYVRDLARALGQPVRLDVRGGDVSLDKAIVDRLGEPLLHVVRNAAAHGFEPPAARLAAGKPIEARIALRAARRADRVIVSVEDDGRGLDLPAITARARRLGVAPDALDEAARRRLVFLPGLSTAAAVTPLAGRGVGLDVVAAAIGALGGTVDVESTPGHGARFWFDLPATLDPHALASVEPR